LHRLLEPRLFVIIVAVAYVAVSLLILKSTVADAKGRADLVSGDAKHYLAIGEDFAAGNWSMDYVKRRPHRQPLYPALIAPVLHASGRDLFRLACVNIAIATLGFIALTAAVLWFTRSPAIAAIVGLLYAASPFLMVQTTRHFMTEPAHFLLMIGVIAFLLAFLQTGKTWLLLAAAAATGLDYLARPNGLFIMASLLAAIVASDAWDCLAARRAPAIGFIIRRTAQLAGALALFAVITIPSWLPRLAAYGKPLHHGYLSNYMWVDTYEQAHTGEDFASFTWRDYAATHTPWDAAVRMAGGVWNVLVTLPFRAEEPLPILYILALAGAGIVIVRGPAPCRVLLLFAVLQLLPLMWTNLSNPNTRVPYGAVFPFELAFAAIGLAALRDGGWGAAIRRPFSRDPNAA